MNVLVKKRDPMRLVPEAQTGALQYWDSYLRSLSPSPERDFQLELSNKRMLDALSHVQKPTRRPAETDFER